MHPSLMEDVYNLDVLERGVYIVRIHDVAQVASIMLDENVGGCYEPYMRTTNDA